MEILNKLPSRTACYDIIYSPVETVFLQQARWSGHRTLNGKGMNVLQAVEAFFHKVCRPLLEEKGLYTPVQYQRVLTSMVEQWN
jgi:hypothetical protein